MPLQKDKDQEELTALYQRNIDAVYRLCYVYLRNRADAEDAVQSVLLRYLQKRPEFHGVSHETAWLLLTAKNCCRDQLRCWWRRQRVNLGGTNTGEEYQTVLSGSWSVRFPLNFEDCSVTYPIAQTISTEGYDITLQSISVSPLSVTLRANSPYTREIIQSLDEKYAPYSDDSPRWFPVTIHYEDGSTETASHGVHMGSTSEINHLTGNILDIITFDSLINDKEINFIEICGTDIPLTQN